MPAATGVVLAGGRSSRMGRPKAWLSFDGQPLIRRIVAALREQFAEVVVVAASGQDLPEMPARVVHDTVASQGPARAIHDGLAAASGEVAFVTSCDAASLNAPLIAHLVSRSPGHDVVVPCWRGRYQPLHAVYRSTVLPVLGAQLQRGELRPVFLFDKVRTCRIGADEIRRFDPDGDSFANINTPQDYADALKRHELARVTRGEPRGSVECTVELFGVPRLIAGTRELCLVLPSRATFAQLFAALGERLPNLVGRVVSPDGRLMEGCSCNVNGLGWMRSAAAPVRAGDRILILSADAGG
ncbi:MAG TPA: NTP transferase domain-containing protein [Vicinamibacterales bacterium]|nr:NTP transferase domain-containing protein [Vicinamibacterales bacterium]